MTLALGQPDYPLLRVTIGLYHSIGMIDSNISFRSAQVSSRAGGLVQVCSLIYRAIMGT